MISCIFYKAARGVKVVGTATMLHTPRIGESVEFVDPSGENSVYDVLRVVYFCPVGVDEPCTTAQIYVE